LENEERAMISKGIPDWLKKQTWDFLQENNMGQRHMSNGTKAQQYTGLLGENMLRLIIGLQPKFVPGYDHGYDLEMNGVKVDVKTMGRTVDPKPTYVNNFIAFQKDLDAQVYVFCSINKSTNVFFVCGVMSKEELLDQGSFFPLGALRYRDDKTTMRMKAPTYEIQNHLLIQIKDPVEIWSYTFYHEPSFLER